MRYFILLITFCANGHLSPVYRTANMHTINTEIIDDNAPATVSPIDTQAHEVNNSTVDKFRSVHTQTPPVNDTTTKQASLDLTPGLINISTEGQKTLDLPEHSINSKAETTDVLNTEVFLDDENASFKSSEGGYEANAPCVSQKTKEAIQTPCGGSVARRPRRCNINNVFHIRQDALRWIQVTKETHVIVQNDDRILSNIHIYRLNKTIRPDVQLDELEKSLQIYFMYLSEANSIYSALALSTGDFVNLRSFVLTALCNLNNAIDTDHVMYNVCLSRDLSVFYTQTVYILESLHTDIETVMAWKHCQASV